MLKRLNNKILLVILLVLIAAVAYTMLKEEKTSSFKKHPVSFDSTAISKIAIKEAQQQALQLVKTNGEWQVQQGSKKDKASESSIEDMLNTLLHLKSQSLVANKPDQWDKYKVGDTSGTRVTLYKNEQKAADLVIGKFDFDRQARSAKTYIRPANKNNVYIVNGFLGRTFKKAFNDLRYKTLVKGNTDDWEKVEYRYPQDSGFVLKKANNNWTINTNDTIDSMKVASYMKRLANLKGGTFLENYDASNKQPLMQVKISGKNVEDAITIKGYPADSVHELAVTSNFNKSFFSGRKSNLIDRIFVSPEYFHQSGKKSSRPQNMRSLKNNPAMQRRLRKMQQRKAMPQ